ncbi:ester cyclase [Consotaella aegiceratis]|uniref:ester cyclase n=1 Tax=Consotaella aegiceratis TaxID=3097961 RepID=UPI002F3E864D
MDRSALESIAARWISLWQGTSLLDAFDDLHAPDFIDHDSANRANDRDGFKAGLESLYAAFPDFCASIDVMMVDEERQLVALRWTALGRHAGPFMGFAPSGRVIRFTGIEIIRIDDGRIADRWGEWNEGALLHQLAPADVS